MKVMESNTTFSKEFNYKACPDYFKSKWVTQEKKVSFENNMYRNVNLENHLAIKRLVDSEGRLKDKRKLAAKQRQDLDKQWEDLVKKEEHLTENFIYFSKFIHENMEKRERAIQRIKKMKEVREERVQYRLKMLNECIEMQELKDIMDARIVKMNIYENFLKQVIKKTGCFSAVKNILRRYEVLIDAQVKLMRMQEINMEQLENIKSDFMKLIEENNFVIMGLNNQIANLQARFENANIKSLESEQLVLQIKNNAVKRMSDIDQVKASIWNVYTHMAHSKKHPVKIKKDNVEEQMMYIKRTLTELSKVNLILRKRGKSPRDTRMKNI